MQKPRSRLGHVPTTSLHHTPSTVAPSCRSQWNAGGTPSDICSRYLRPPHPLTCYILFQASSFNTAPALKLPDYVVARIGTWAKFIDCKVGRKRRGRRGGEMLRTVLFIKFVYLILATLSWNIVYILLERPHPFANGIAHYTSPKDFLFSIFQRGVYFLFMLLE